MCIKANNKVIYVEILFCHEISQGKTWWNCIKVMQMKFLISSLLNIIYHGSLLRSDKLLLFVGLCWYRPDFAKKQIIANHTIVKPSIELEDSL